MLGPALLVYLIERAIALTAWPRYAIRSGNAAEWLAGVGAAVVPLLAAVLVVYLAVRFGG